MTSLRTVFLICLSSLFIACSSTPTVTSEASYGAFPDNYQQLVKDYLKRNSRTKSLNLENINFINVPDQYGFKQVGRSVEYGYRVCALVKSQDNRKVKAHFFLIQDHQVRKNLHDTGLLGLSDEYCNVAAMTATPGNTAPVETAEPESDSLKYLACEFEDDQRFFVFDAERHEIREELHDESVATLQVKRLSETGIDARSETARLQINRITGAARYKQNGATLNGSCELIRKQKF